MENVKRITRARANQIESRQQITIPGTDTALSNACEDYLTVRDTLIKRTKDLKEDKDAVSVASERVAEIMVSLGMETCRHGRMTFRVKEAKEVKPKVAVTEDK